MLPQGPLQQPQVSLILLARLRLVLVPTWTVTSPPPTTAPWESKGWMAVRASMTSLVSSTSLWKQPRERSTSTDVLHVDRPSSPDIAWYRLVSLAKNNPASNPRPLFMVYHPALSTNSRPLP